MIITEEITKVPPRNEPPPPLVYRPGEPTQSTPLRQPDSGGGSEPPPPPYHGSTDRVPSPVAPYVGAGYTVLVYRYGQSPFTRFLKAFMVAWIVWLLLVAAAQTLAMMIMWRSPHGPRRGPGDWPPSKLVYDIPDGVQLSNCVQMDDWAVRNSWPKLPSFFKDATAETAFDLPLASHPNMLLLSRIGHPPRFPFNFLSSSQHQVLRNNTLIVRTSRTQQAGVASVRVCAKYPPRQPLPIAKVCLVHRNQAEKDAQSGVGIFTPIPPSRQSTSRIDPGNHKAEHSSENGGSHGPILFDVELVLPEDFALPRLEIDMPDTIQHIEDLSRRDRPYFGEVSLKGMNSQIHAKLLQGSDISVSGVNTSITGAFVATNSFHLLTRDAPIDVDVILRNRPGNDLPTIATLENGNAPLAARITLVSAYENTTAVDRHSFVIAAATYGAPLTLSVPDQPPNSHLSLSAEILDVQSSVSEHRPSDAAASESKNSAVVMLNTAFEGDFRVFVSGPDGVADVKEDSSSGASSALEREPQSPSDIVGPSHSERKYSLTLRKSGDRLLEGSVKWEDPPGEESEDGVHGQGMVVVSTVSGSAELHV